MEMVITKRLKVIWKRSPTPVALAVRYRKENRRPLFQVLRWESKIRDQAPVIVCAIILIGFYRTPNPLRSPTTPGLELAVWSIPWLCFPLAETVFRGTGI